MSQAEHIAAIVERLVRDVRDHEGELGVIDDRATVADMAHAELVDLVVKMSEVSRLMRVDIADIVTVLAHLGQRTQSWPEALDDLDRRHGVPPIEVEPYVPPGGVGGVWQ